VETKEVVVEQPIMRYVIGVDAGPAGTTAVLVDASGHLLGAGQGGSAVLERDEAGAQRVRRALGDAILGAITMADLENARISAACISMAGDPEELECMCAPVVPADHFTVGSLTHIALNTVSLGAPGVVVVADVGAEAYGVNLAHESAAAGGWGQAQGDEGSAYWIALRALNACCKDRDRTGPSTQILPLLLQHLEAHSLEHIHRRINTGMMSRTEIAALIEIVSLAAAQGDPTARRLLREAGKELGLMVAALMPRLKMADDAVTVGTVGGVFRAGRLVLRTFREVVQARAPRCNIIGPQAPNCVGAAITAMEDIGIEIHEGMVSSILNTLPRIQSVKNAA
jgi:N-acetylglucosamine kinase-like BadF-type ATPase